MGLDKAKIEIMDELSKDKELTILIAESVNTIVSNLPKSLDKSEKTRVSGEFVTLAFFILVNLLHNKKIMWFKK